MELNKKDGRFSHEGLSTHCFEIMKFKGTIQEKEISIYLCSNETENYISIELANSNINSKVNYN